MFSHSFPRSLPSSRAMIPDVFDTIVSKAMAIDPEARYQTPQALVEAFEQALRASGEAPEEAGREGAPLFLLAELATIDDSLASPSEELWDDLETVRATFHELTKPPYVVHAVTDTSILVERRGAPGTAERVIDDCRSLAERHVIVTVNVSVGAVRHREFSGTAKAGAEKDELFDQGVTTIRRTSGCGC